MDSLPNEVFIEIFDQLKCRDLKNLLSTCKQFNKIISETAVLMDKLRLSIDGDSMSISESRNYRNLKIRNPHKNQNLILQQQFNSLWENIVDLNIVFDRAEINCTNINKLLNQTPNLKHLRLSFPGSASDLSDLNLKTLPKLKLDSLTIFSCVDDAALQLLQHSRVKKLDISLNGFRGNRSEPLKKFLKQQPELEHLIINYLTLNELTNVFDADMIEADFKLKSLRLSMKEFSPSNLEHFQKFLQHQTSLGEVMVSIRKLSDNEPALMHILGEIQQIKKLDLANIKFNFKPMHFVETLSLYISLGHQQNFHNFHVIFPNVKDLTFERYNNLKFVEKSTDSECNKIIISNVKSLTLKFIDFSNKSPFNYAYIKVEDLKLDYCENIDWLFEYLRKDGAKFNLLELKRIRITRNEQQFLESLNRGSEKKINELRLYCAN